MTPEIRKKILRIFLPLLLFTGGAVPLHAQNPPDTTAFQLPEELDEVVVIAYGTAKRKDFVGSVSSVRVENSPIALMNNSNALETLKGNVAGLDIGAVSNAGGQPSMQMRGQRSISGSNAPLIVLDGVIYIGGINEINPADIATIDVLKDASSAAAFGSRSANGVILITTKKGTSEKPTISFNASAALQIVVQFFVYIPNRCSFLTAASPVQRIEQVLPYFLNHVRLMSATGIACELYHARQIVKTVHHVIGKVIGTILRVGIERICDFELFPLVLAHYRTCIVRAGHPVVERRVRNCRKHHLAVLRKRVHVEPLGSID